MVTHKILVLGFRVRISAAQRRPCVFHITYYIPWINKLKITARSYGNASGVPNPIWSWQLGKTSNGWVAEMVYALDWKVRVLAHPLKRTPRMEKNITMAYAALLPQPERQCSQTYSTLPKRTRLYWRTCTGLSAPQKSFEFVFERSIIVNQSIKVEWKSILTRCLSSVLFQRKEATNAAPIPL